MRSSMAIHRQKKVSTINILTRDLSSMKKGGNITQDNLQSSIPNRFVMHAFVYSLIPRNPEANTVHTENVA